MTSAKISDFLTPSPHVRKLTQPLLLRLLTSVCLLLKIPAPFPPSVGIINGSPLSCPLLFCGTRDAMCSFLPSLLRPCLLTEGCLPGLSHRAHHSHRLSNSLIPSFAQVRGPLSTRLPIIRTRTSHYCPAANALLVCEPTPIYLFSPTDDFMEGQTSLVGYFIKFHTPQLIPCTYSINCSPRGAIKWTSRMILRGSGKSRGLMPLFRSHACVPSMPRRRRRL